MSTASNPNECARALVAHFAKALALDDYDDDYVLKPKLPSAATPEEIHDAIRAYRAKPALLVVPQDIREYVTQNLLKYGELTENFVYSKKHATVNMTVSLGETGYKFIIEGPNRPIDYCKVASIYVDPSTGSRSEWINDFCATKEDLLELFEKAESRISYWDTEVKYTLLNRGFGSLNKGECATLVGTLIVHALPSLFPGCICVLVRGKGHKDLVPGNLSELRDAIREVRA